MTNRLYSLNELERERKVKRKAERKATLEDVVSLGVMLVFLYIFCACVYSF